MNLPRIGLLGIITALCLVGMSAARERTAEPVIVRIGLSESLFGSAKSEKEEKKMLADMDPFIELIKQRTEIQGEFVVVRGVPALVKAFEEHKVHMAVLPGVEYGWLRAKFPNAKPLLVTVQDTTQPKAFVLVNKDSAAKNVADLQGKALAMPPRPLQYTLFYLERLVNQEPGKYFDVQNVNNAEAAIEAVIDGTAQATLIGNAALDVYRNRKPVRFKRLKILEESPEFPPSVIVYDILQSNDETLKKFRDNLLTANQTVEGRQTLNLWHLSSFQDATKDYDRQVEAIVKRYPAP